MKCYKCGKEIVDGEYKKVADWVFCNECFRALLENKESEQVDNTKKESLTEKKEEKRCQICGKSLSDKDVKSLLGLDFCPSCYEALLSKPKVIQKSSNKSKQNKLEHEYKVPQVEVNLRETIECFGCGRKIPKAGAKELDGHLYCPDCYKELLDVLEEKSKARLTIHVSNSTSTKLTSTSHITCQSCGRAVEKKFIRQVEGFDICMACLSADPDTAIAIAKQRHKMFLKNLIKNLNTNS